MAPAACQSLHELEGLCEYCGEVCDSTQDELNAIACTFEGCPSPTIYHQHCMETYLKTIRLDKYVISSLCHVHFGDREYIFCATVFANRSIFFLFFLFFFILESEAEPEHGVASL